MLHWHETSKSGSKASETHVFVVILATLYCEGHTLYKCGFLQTYSVIWWIILIKIIIRVVRMKDAEGGWRLRTHLNTSIKSNESVCFDLWTRMMCAEADDVCAHMWTPPKANTFRMESTYLEKYNLDMSLSEEMWCWMSDSSKYYDNILKQMKNARKLR